MNLREFSNTKRGVLSTIASLYDPLSFVCPIVLEPKVLFQQLCRQKFGWDVSISDPELEKWQRWLNRLQELSHIQIPRCFTPKNLSALKSIEIHNFADASSYAYAACLYLHLVDTDDNIFCAFVIAKSRLAPIKAVSIPRLELIAAVLAVRLNALVKGELKFDVYQSYFWIDSTAVLLSILNRSKRFPIFVANRLAIIEQSSDSSEWHFLPSKLNAADLPSRGLMDKPIDCLNSWLKGPQFLRESKALWPQFPVKLDAQFPKEFSPLKHPTVFSNIATENDCAILRLIERCSSLYKLKRLMALLLRCQTKFSRRTKISKLEPPDLSLSVDELRCAETELIKFLQRAHFPDVFAQPRHAEQIVTKNLLRYLQKLHPVIFDGVLRVGGRLGGAPVDFDSKHPVILPQHSHFTELVIREHHALVGHSGANHTWASLRQKFWIVKEGAAVRSSIEHCVLCKKRNSSLNKQFMADLLPCRLQVNEPPFYNVGVDYFGPFLIKQKRSLVKRYGCLFTCLSMRAVHIEIANSLTADSFINALRRFIARRGKPDHIYSDNGSNFVGANCILRESLDELNQKSLNQFCCQQEIKWTFNPPTASHMGGAWERMIRSVRKILTALTRDQALDDEAFSTFITEVEGILNSRPLVPIMFDDSTQNEPLTPNHLLLLRGTANLPPGLFSKRDCYARRRWAQVQFLSNQFWCRWVNEFIPNLTQRQKWFQPERNVQVGDVDCLQRACSRGLNGSWEGY